MKKRIFIIFSVVLLFWNVAAFAVLPWIVYGVAAAAGAAFFHQDIYDVSHQLYRQIKYYTAKNKNFYFDPINDVYSTITYAVPQSWSNSSQANQNGVQLNMQVEKDAVRQQIKNNPSQYPQIANDINASNQGMSQDSWGTGDQYDESKIPQVGDYVLTNDGKIRRIDKIRAFCGSAPAYSCSSPIGRSYIDGSSLYIITPHGECSVNSEHDPPCTRGRIQMTFTTVTSMPPAEEPTEEQWQDAMNAHPDEVVQAMRDVFNSLHGPSGTSLPSSSSPARLTNPVSGGGPVNPQDILQAVDSTTGEGVPQPDTQTQTTTTITQGESTVETAADGTRTVTTPTTRTVTDSDGNVISETTETIVKTYPPGIPLPDDLGVTEESETTEEKSEKTPDAMTTPEAASIDFSPLLKAGEILGDKFPISMVTVLTDVIADLGTTPETPEYVIDVGELGGEMTVSFRWLDSFAGWFRGLLGAIALILATFEAIRIWL